MAINRWLSFLVMHVKEHEVIDMEVLHDVATEYEMRPYRELKRSIFTWQNKILTPDVLAKKVPWTESERLQQFCSTIICFQFFENFMVKMFPGWSPSSCLAFPSAANLRTQLFV
jgi:hypothetical protein